MAATPKFQSRLVMALISPKMKLKEIHSIGNIYKKRIEKSKLAGAQVTQHGAVALDGKGDRLGELVGLMGPPL